MGGIGSGKTRIGCLWAFRRAKGMKRKVLVVVPTASLGEDIFLRTMVEDVFDHIGLIEGIDYSINRSKLNIKFRHGGEILIRSGDDPKKLRGPNMHDALIEEFQMYKTDKVHKIVTGRIRNSEDAQLRMVGTPESHKWIVDLIVNSSARIIQQTTLENKFLPKSYIADLIEEYGEGSPWYRQEILGELVDFSAGVFEVSKLLPMPPKVDAQFNRVCRAWDFASSKKSTADYTATAKMGINEGQKKEHIIDVQRKKGAYGGLKDWIVSVMESENCIQLIENTQAGQVIASDIETTHPHLADRIELVPPVTDKVTRALPFSGRMAIGLVTIDETIKILDDVKDELRSFPDGRNDDMVDALSYCHNNLNQPVRKAEYFTIQM